MPIPRPGVEIVSGEEVGCDPYALTTDELARLGHDSKPILSVFRAHCTNCSGGSATEARKCTVTGCALWPYRTGSNPFRARKVLSEDQKAALRGRLAVPKRAA